MDYEKNKEALDMVCQMVNDGQISQDVAEKYFPELRYSIDDKIRNAIGTALTCDSAEKCLNSFNIGLGDALTCLERQKHRSQSEEQLDALLRLRLFAQKIGPSATLMALDDLYDTLKKL